MHDIVFLWSHPRSLSSAMERAMVERGDLRAFHEPFLYLYYLGDARRPLAHFTPDPAHPTSYTGIKRMLLEAAQGGPVFVKDMCYYVADYLAQDDEFVARVRNTFLIREPARAIASYLRLDPEVTREEVGLDSQWRVFEQVRRLCPGTPVVIDAEDLQRQPVATVAAYCAAIGLPFLPEALQWESALPADWGFVAGWHEALASSRGLGRAGVTPPPDLDAHPSLRPLLAYHQPYYERLRAFKLTPSAK